MQNIAWSIIYHAVAIPLALLGVLAAIHAAFAMAMSGLVINSRWLYIVFAKGFLGSV